MRKNIIDFKTDDKITEFYLVKSCVRKTSNKGGDYMDMLLADNTGEVSAKVWDLKRPETAEVNDIEGREVVKVQGLVTEWNGAKQLKIVRLRKATDDDNVDISQLVRTAPISGEKLYEFIHEKAMSIKDDDFRNLTVTLMEENEEKLKYFPAATKNHHAVKGGLLYHVYRMLLNGECFCKVYPMLKRDLILCGVILHDIAKLEEIDADEMGMADEYTLEGQMLGHLVMGINMIDRTCRKLGISREKSVMIEHMILSHHYEPEFGSPKKPMFPEAEMLHYLDVIDARIYDMEKNLEGVEPGNFSDRIWSMENRKMYKPGFEV